MATKKTTEKKTVVKKAAKKATEKTTVTKKVATKKAVKTKVEEVPAKTTTKKAKASSTKKQTATPSPKKVATKKVATPKETVAEKKIVVKKAAKKATAAKTTKVKAIKLPKITTKEAQPYKPGYTPIEKREAKNSKPLIRYGEDDLKEFKELILKKLADAKKELNYMQGILTRRDENEEIENRYMTIEDGADSMQREQMSQMANRMVSYIQNLEKALVRIENKTYGICKVTGQLIDKARLKAVPHTTHSLEAKLNRK